MITSLIFSPISIARMNKTPPLIPSDFVKMKNIITYRINIEYINSSAFLTTIRVITDYITK